MKTADFKNNLSYYLRMVRRSGQSITICDRETPVAVLSPFPTKDSEAWATECTARAALLFAQGLILRAPALRPSRPALRPPLLAGDGKASVRSVETTRRRDY